MLEGQSVSEPRSCGMHANDQRQRAWHVSDVERADACRWVMLTLVLCACEGVGDDGLRHLSRLSHLRELYLNRCVRVSDDGLRALTPRLRHTLHTLILEGYVGHYGILLVG